MRIVTLQTNTFNDYLNNTKLSTKIVGTIIIITFAIFGLISYFINDAVRSNTLEAEKDKAEILLDSLSADISMDIYLGLLDDSREKVSKLLKRDEVLKITVKAMPSDKILISDNARVYCGQKRG